MTATDTVRAAPAPSSRGRRRPGTRRGWQLASGVIAAIVIAPVAGVASSVFQPTREVWALLWETQLVDMFTATIVLMVGVVVGTIVIGGGLAWLTAIYRFPGHGALSWLLVLPLAVPAYVLGFVAIGLLDAPGPLQQTIRAMAGDDAVAFDPRTMGMAIAVFTLALYPYVYLLVRATLADQSPTPYHVARTLGLSPAAAARRVLLPLARPAFAAGAALVAMETLTDFATVQYFNVETVSVGVERVWHGMYERQAAAELAFSVLALAILIIAAERLLRG
ncbi:MAG: ABC transporter permease subunit, partial [Nitriliruptoraceae bacterium]